MTKQDTSYRTSISVPIEIHELILEAKPPGVKYATFLHQMMGAILQDGEFIDQIYKAMYGMEKRDIFSVVEISIRKAIEDYNSKK